MNLTQLRCVVVEKNTETGVNMGQISPEMGIEKQRRDLIWRSVFNFIFLLKIGKGNEEEQATGQTSPVV